MILVKKKNANKMLKQRHIVATGVGQSRDTLGLGAPGTLWRWALQQCGGGEEEEEAGGGGVTAAKVLRTVRAVRAARAVKARRGRCCESGEGGGH